MSKLNVEKIKELKADPGFEPIIKAIEQRERDRGVTDIRQFYNSMLEKAEQAGEKLPALSLEQAVTYFRELDDAGFGTFVEGGRGKTARFKWRFKIKTVGPALRDPDNYANNVISISGYRGRTKTDAPEQTSAVNMAEIKEKVAKRVRKAPVAPVVRLPKGETVDINLSIKDNQMHVSFPSKISAVQAKQICSLIQSLAG